MGTCCNSYNGENPEKLCIPKGKSFSFQSTDYSKNDHSIENLIIVEDFVVNEGDLYTG